MVLVSPLYDSFLFQIVELYTMIQVNQNVSTLVSFIGDIFLIIIQMNGKISLLGLDVMRPHQSWNLVIILIISLNFGFGLLIEDKR